MRLNLPDITMQAFHLHRQSFILYTPPMPQLILVVDDEPKVARLARDYLEKNGFRVITAADGQSALTIARREKPDLVILDLMLPNIDGREVCRILRRESDVPIIMLTALSEEIDQVTGLEIGADDYITKPFSPRALVARVRALLRRTRAKSKRQASSALAGLKSTRKNILSPSTAFQSNSRPTNSNSCICSPAAPVKPSPASNCSTTCTVPPPASTAVWTRTSRICARNSKPPPANP